MRGWFVLTFMKKERGEAWFLFCVDIMKKLVFRLRFCDSMNVYRWITSDCDKTLNTVDCHYFKIVTIGDWIVIIENWWSHSPGLLSWSCRGPGPLWCCGCGSLFPGNLAEAGGQVSCVPHGSGSLKLWHCALKCTLPRESSICHVMDCWNWTSHFRHAWEGCGLTPHHFWRARRVTLNLLHLHYFVRRKQLF